MKTAKPKIVMEQKGIGLIMRENILRVPSHQREYSWTKKEVQKLFQDLAKAIADDDSEYFLGIIAAFRGAGNVLEVIDGQQRLATITVLLSQIRDYLKTRDEFLAKSVNPFLEYPDREQRADVPRLTLNLTDNHFFSGMLTAAKKSDRPVPTMLSQRLILAAFEEAEKRVKSIVSGFAEKDHGDVLNKWITFLEGGSEVILLEMPKGYNAYRMFETLNDRGLETSQADLVKNYIFEEAGETRLKEAEISWSNLKSVLDVLHDDKDLTVVFMRAALILIQGPLTKDQLYDAIQGRAKGTVAAITFCRQLEALAGSYVATFFSDHEKWNAYPDAVKYALRTLNFFNIQPFRPVILAIADKFTPNEASKAFQMLVSLGVRITIATSTSSGSIEDSLHPAANAIFKGTITTAKELRKMIDSIVPTDEKFRTAFSIATVSKGPLARYYLRSLERVAKREPTPWYNVNDDKEVIDLEHVLPQEPKGNYPKFTDDEHAAFYRRLGNLALHAKILNSENRSDSFKDKRSTYKGCPFVFTSQLFRVPDWTKEYINKRQAQMADKALKAWPI